MRQPYRLLTLGLALCAAVALVGALILLNRSHTADVDAEVGKWLLTLAAALVLTGALSMVVKQIDQRRSERQAWHDILNDLVAANQKLALARVRLQAHRSARTYQDQLAEVMAARVEMRRIGAIDIVNRDPSLTGWITAMKEYLDALGHEFAAGYLHAARQQRLDEVWLDEKMKAANQGSDAPELPGWLAEPTTAWRMLTDASRFPRLGTLLDDDAFPIDTFRTNYKLAKERLEMHAGFGKPSAESRKTRARKLAIRAGKFTGLHAEVLGELSRQVDDSVRRLEVAHEAGDSGAIQKETVTLGELTAEAVARIYREPKADSTATDSSAAALLDIQAQGAAPPRPVGTDV
jgi:hypothetical protein